jgi:hypothetical protein
MVFKPTMNGNPRVSGISSATKMVTPSPQRQQGKALAGAAGWGECRRLVSGSGNLLRPGTKKGGSLHYWGNDSLREPLL